MNLENLINEFLFTLDGNNDEEYFMTDREHASKWLRMFIKWMRKKHVTFIGNNYGTMELPQSRLDTLRSYYD